VARARGVFGGPAATPEPRIGPPAGRERLSDERAHIPTDRTPVIQAHAATGAAGHSGAPPAGARMLSGGGDRHGFTRAWRRGMFYCCLNQQSEGEN
jgi:hypothetical protein